MGQELVAETNIAKKADKIQRWSNPLEGGSLRGTETADLQTGQMIGKIVVLLETTMVTIIHLDVDMVGAMTVVDMADEVAVEVIVDTRSMPGFRTLGGGAVIRN